MIWNQHISKKSWIYLNQDITKFYKKNSDLTEAESLEMPKNNWDATYTDNETKQKFSTPNTVNASFKFVTLGYKIDDQKKKFGFDFIIVNQNKKSDEPYIFRIINNSQKDSYEKLGTIREVGFVFDNWPQYWKSEDKWTGGQHSFSGNYQVEKLDNLKVKFKFRLVNFNMPLNKKMIRQKWLGSYATCDLRFNGYDENGQIVNKYLIGVVFSNPLKVDYNDNLSDDALFGKGEAKADEQQILLLHGGKIGLNEVNVVSRDNVFKTVEIDFKPLIKKYLNINKNHKNIITGLDIYSATRATDFAYEIQDIQVIGCEKK
ncbi:hypothetical protein [Chryseobacterium wangxinyae]|uniref:hypothetical protein n=1 Tax=Chryseobacterium sp. CY353 TaxID=2997334 RepID=UPI00226D666D|nr:hypothetical protein [Chryseobacterium sp. CY353]